MALAQANWSSTIGDIPPQTVGIAITLGVQASPVEHDTAATLAVTDMTGGLIVSNPAAAINLTLPTGAAMDAALPQAAVNSSFDFSIINLGTGSNIPTVVTNTGWTLVGEMALPAETVNGAGRFKARRTAPATWTLYRIS
jgi:hypothetical protein